MARILILQEAPGELGELQLSLEDHHQVVFERSQRTAIEALMRDSFDLIICRVYLEQGDMFAFLRLVKQNRKWKNIPFVCWAGLRSECARSLNETTATSARSLGATAFYRLDDFSHGSTCDTAAIREAIERHLPPPAVHHEGSHC